MKIMVDVKEFSRLKSQLWTVGRKFEKREVTKREFTLALGGIYATMLRMSKTEQFSDEDIEKLKRIKG